ncbi:MAG: DUF6989 domain-containing protein [Candidatus Hodarchaeales archaeon]
MCSFIIFGLSEETLWVLPSWQAQNVAMFSHVALYIIIPEMILGLSTFIVFKSLLGKQHYFKIILAFVVMLLYLRSASFFYFLIEVIILG